MRMSKVDSRTEVSIHQIKLFKVDSRTERLKQEMRISMAYSGEKRD